MSPFRDSTVWAIWDPAIPWAILPFGVVSLAAGALMIWPPRAPDGVIIWSVMLLGIVGALTALMSVLRLEESYQWPLIESIWVPILAAVMPMCAAVAVPRVFGSWLLAGWSLGGLNLYSYVSARLGGPSSDTPWIVLGVTLVALLPAAWFLGRTESRTDVDGSEATYA